MKHILSAALLLCSLSLLSVTCNKDDKPTPDPSPTPSPGLTLPITVDLKSIPSANGKATFEAGGITFTGAGTTASDFENGKIKCIEANTTNIRHGTGSGVILAYSDFSCLIADVSKLPAMQKITVKLFNNGGNGTQISLCDGNQVIAQTNEKIGTNPEVTYTLNVGGKTGSKFYVVSGEATVYSVTFE